MKANIKSAFQRTLLVVCLIQAVLLFNQRSDIENLSKLVIELETERDSILKSEEYLKTLQMDKDNFFTACSAFNITNPEIVYCQALLESGHFTSRLYKSKNNFLGLYNSKKKEFYYFDHWTQCLKGYADLVQYKYDRNTYLELYPDYKEHDRYFRFLSDLGYAEDPEYISKIKLLYAKNFQ